MPHFFVILLKINLVLLLFGATYYLVLRRLTFYTLNRIFLVFGILFSTVYPFIDLTDFFHNRMSQKAAFVPELNEKATELVPSQFIALNWQLLTVLFYAGVVLMALRLLLQFVSLYRMHRKSAPGHIADYPVRLLDEPVSPFSFWQTVYVNPSLHQEKELATILEHEKIHVKQWHSLDIILAELSVVFYWFNPGVWLMKKAVKENLEFITDEKILKKGIDRKTYQYSLLDVGSLTPSAAIVNNFNLSDLKKRIKMMNAKRSSRLTLSRYLFALPVLLVTTLAFTVSKKEIKKHLEPLRAAISHTIDVKAEVVNQPQKQLAKRKKTVAAKTLATDSVGKIKLFFKHVSVAIDSLKEGGFDLPLLAKDENAMELIAAALKGKVQGKNVTVIARSDTIKGVGFTTGKVENVRIGFKKTTTPPVEGEEPLKDRVIVVTGYATKRKAADSTVTTSGKFNYYLDGVKIPEEDVKKVLDPNLVKGVSLKRKDAHSASLMIETKKN